MQSDSIENTVLYYLEGGICYRGLNITAPPTSQSERDLYYCRHSRHECTPTEAVFFLSGPSSDCMLMGVTLYVAATT